ncbi:tRNA (guanosine(46)-N7)-methyltransferase TrmB, partial [Streptomyces sp. NPDC056121]
MSESPRTPEAHTPETSGHEASGSEASGHEASGHVRAKGEPRFPDGPAPDPAGSHFERRIRSFQPRR